MSPKSVFFIILGVVAIISLIIFSFETSFTVENGTYAIKQAAVSGDLVAYMKPGMHPKFFGSITTFPVAETFYFCKDNEGVGQSTSATTADNSIEVRFNDGSICNISGTCRVDLPRDEDEAIGLITKFGYRSHTQLEQKLILPVIRRALNMTANLMSSKESYSDKRPDFFKFAWDQIENGVYQTKDEMTTETDIITGTDVKKVRKIILTDEKTGKTLREQNPLEGTGIKLSIFEIKDFQYDDKVKVQISSQQEALMSVQTARANAQKAAQDALTTEALGKAAVMKAQYEELEKKEHATVQAQREAEVAVIQAQQTVDVNNKAKEAALVLAEQSKQTALIAANREKEVAAVDLDAAKLTKQSAIEVATGQAEARKLILASDGALAQKLAAWLDAQKAWATAYAQHQVPQVMMGGRDGGSQTETQGLLDMLQVKAAKDLALDMKIASPTAVK